MNNKIKFSLDDFKKWMNTHESKEFKTDRPKNGLIGVSVESKLASDRIAAKITLYDELDSEQELAEEFSKKGGKIADVDGKNFLIEVKSGLFYIHRCYVARI
jgi:hypothetical protein